MNKFLPKPLQTLVLGTALLLGANHVRAQVSAYTFVASTTTYAPLPATATSAPTVQADDAVSGVLPLGFSFTYEGISYADAVVSSNGFLSFNPASGSNLGNSLEGTGSEHPIVAPFWDDLDGRDPSARASYQTTGTAPNRVFTFEWLNWFRYNNTGGPSFSMQVRLLEGSNRIELVYRRETGTVTTASASVGIAGAVVGTTPPEFLSLNNTTAAPTASSATETATIADVPATGQVYTFAPGVVVGCPAARSVAATTITGTSASITFRGATTSASYTVTYQAAGGPVQIVNPTPTTSPVALTGLMPNTAYTVTVVANCAGGVTAAPATANFSTSNRYCSTGLGGSCGGNNVVAVRLAGTALNAAGLTCTASGGNAYTNYPAIAPNTGIIQRGISYALGVTTTGSSIISAWVDYDQNGTFDASEWVQVATASTANTVAVVNLVVPGNAVSGPTVIRVRSRGVGNTNGASDACANFGSGETKDFILNVGGVPFCAPPVNLAVNSITANSASFTFSTAGTGTAQLVYGPTGFDPLTGGIAVSPVASPVTITSLLSNTNYDFYVRVNCGGGNVSQYAGPVAFTTLLANDEPCGALALGNGTIANGNNTNSTTSLQPGINLPACSPSVAPKDIWFAFTAAQTTSALTLTGSAAGMVRVFTTPDCANGPFVQVGCQSSGANNTGVTGLALTGLSVGQRYYVAVSGYGSSNATGAFTISATNVLGTRTLANTEALLVYPNPSNTGQLTLRLAPAAGPRQATLLNALGQTVRRETLTGTGAEHTLSTRQLPAGVYTLRVSQNGETLTRKVVLE